MEPLTQSDNNIKTTLPAFGGKGGVDAYQKAMIEMGKNLCGNFGINVVKGKNLHRYHARMTKSKMMKLFRDLGVAGAKNVVVKDQTTEEPESNSNGAGARTIQTRSQTTQADASPRSKLTAKEGWQRKRILTPWTGAQAPSRLALRKLKKR